MSRRMRPHSTSTRSNSTRSNSTRRQRSRGGGTSRSSGRLMSTIRQLILPGVVTLGGVSVLAARRRLRRERSRTDGRTSYEPIHTDGPPVVTEDGVTLHVELDELATDPDGITIVMVHGYALSFDCWHHQRLHFRDRARVVLYDQRSHGRSERSDPQRCRIPQLSKDLAQVLDEVVGDGPVLLLGHSMGGMTIMHLAQDHPEWFGSRVIGVGLCTTSAGDLSEHSVVPFIPGKAFVRIVPPLLSTLTDLPQLVSRARRAGAEIGWATTRWMGFGRDDLPAAMVDFVEQMLEDVPVETVADFYPAFAEVDESAAFPILEQIPTSVIGAAKDTITPVGHTEKIVSLLPEAMSLIVPDAGHMVMIEHHEVVNTAFDELLERARAVLVASGDSESAGR